MAVQDQRAPVKKGPQALASEAHINARPLAIPSLLVWTLLFTKIMEDVKPRTLDKNRKEISIKSTPRTPALSIPQIKCQLIYFCLIVFFLKR